MSSSLAISATSLALPACGGNAVNKQDSGASTRPKIEDSNSEESGAKTSSEDETSSKSDASTPSETSEDAKDDSKKGEDEEESGEQDPGDDTGDIPLFDLAVPDFEAEPIGCPTLIAKIRDFKISHPDFEEFSGSYETKGLVEDTLGPDGRPVHKGIGPTSQTTGRENFDQWYRDVDGVNQRFSAKLKLEINDKGICSFNSPEFFPIDGKGWGSEGLSDHSGKERNWAFTTEIQTDFIYREGQVFTFTGDDDLWMFIDDKLVIDLGGLHPPRTATIELDELGFKAGTLHHMSVFHAERHSVGSSFRIDTDLEIVAPG